jgi:predicted  nucleic acid-binding Zn-ribbon protein
MSRSSVERRLSQVSLRLRQLRDELAVSAEQLDHLADAADDARLRSLVSETPVADHDHREAERHADAMRRHRAKVEAEIARLERDQDALLDRFVAESKSR